MQTADYRQLEAWLGLPRNHLDQKAHRTALERQYGLSSGQLGRLYRALRPDQEPRLRLALAHLKLPDTLEHRLKALKLLDQEPWLEEAWRQGPPEAVGDLKIARQVKWLLEWGLGGPWPTLEALEAAYRGVLEAWGLSEAEWEVWKQRGWRHPADTAFARGFPPPPPPPPFRFPLPALPDLGGLRFLERPLEGKLAALPWLSRWAKHPWLARATRRNLYAIKTHFLRQGLLEGWALPTTLLHGRRGKPDPRFLADLVGDRLAALEDNEAPDEDTWRLLAALGTQEAPPLAVLEEFLAGVLETWTEDTLGAVPSYLSYIDVAPAGYDKPWEEVFQQPWLWGLLDLRGGDLVELRLPGGALLHAPWRQVADLLPPLPTAPRKESYGRPPLPEEKDWPLERVLEELGVKGLEVEWYQPRPRWYLEECGEDWEDEEDAL